MHFKTDLAPTGEGHGGAMPILKKIVSRILWDIRESARLFWSAFTKALAITVPPFVIILLLVLASPASAQSQQDDEPCVECAVVVIGGGLLIAAIVDAMFGGGSSSSSSDRDCSGSLIPAPEGGLMSSNPDC